MSRVARYRTIQRWHFLAGLFVMPMLLLLSVTGGIYLFKPQVDAWEERAFDAAAMAEAPSLAVAPDDHVAAALRAFPHGSFRSYRLPRSEGAAALVLVGLPDGGSREVFVSPHGRVVGTMDPRWRIMQVVHDVHGQLLVGPRGSWLVELAASWSIAMIAGGLYLWWPRGRGTAGVLWPRLHLGARAALRDMHAVTGFWVSGLALVLLVTGLPWADVWGSAFKAVRAEFGWQKGVQDWTIGGRAPDAGEHFGHEGMGDAAQSPVTGRPVHAHGSHHGNGATGPFLAEIVARAKSERLAFPVVVTPPGAPGRFGGNSVAAWTVRSDTQNRTLRVTLTYDARNGRETSRETFADRHPIDRVIGYGVAWHEGQLFGPVNQLIGVLTVTGLAGMSVTGFLMWRRRKSAAGVGVPAAARSGRAGWGSWLALGTLAAVLPLLALSLVAVLALQWLRQRTPDTGTGRLTS